MADFMRRNSLNSDQAEGAADFSWYTKRATLAGVYAATLLFWLRDDSEDDAATLAFLDRRLEGVARFGRPRRRAEEILRGSSRVRQHSGEAERVRAGQPPVGQFECRLPTLPRRSTVRPPIQTTDIP
jgi:hypothetical protein